MKVFQMRADPNHYQSFTPGFLYCYGYPIGKDGILPPLHIDDPTLPAGDFFNADTAYLITSPRATDALRNHFAHAGEIIPIAHGDQTFACVNVTLFPDVLDYDRVEFRGRAANGATWGIERYAFHAHRFPNTSLFKLHEDRGQQIYVVEGANDFGEEFREIVASAGLVGLKFREVWNNEPGFCGTPWSIRDYLVRVDEEKG